MGLGWQELLIVLVILLLIFGGKRLPEVASSLGRSIKVFRRASNEPEDDAADGEPAPRDASTS